MAVLAVAALVIFLLTNERIRLLVAASYQVAMKKITGAVIEMDPIAIIEGYLRTLGDSLVKMAEQLNLLKGQEVKLVTKIQKNKIDMENGAQKAKFAQAKLGGLNPETVEYQELQGMITLEGRQYGRLQKTNGKLEEVLTKIVNLRKILEKMHTTSRYVLADMTQEVKMQKEEMLAVNAGYGAFKSAMKVLNGSPGEKELSDQAMEFMAEDLGNKVGEIQRFMENSGSILTGMDIDNEMFAAKGLKMIDEWSNKGDQMFITSPKEALKLSGVQVPTTTVLPAQTVSLGTKSKYR